MATKPRGAPLEDESRFGRGTHVPAQMGSEEANLTFGLRKTVGKTLFSALNLIGVFVFGWPLYLLMKLARPVARENKPLCAEDGREW